MPIDKALLEILVCPKCHGELVVLPDDSAFACNACLLLYRVENDIPNFLIDDATRIDKPVGAAGPV